MEGIYAGKIGAIILIGFAEKTDFDHVEDDFAKVLALGYSPFAEDGEGDRAELIDGVATDALEEFMAANVMNAAFRGFFEFFDGIIEAFPHKAVGFLVVAGVRFDELPDFAAKFGGVHNQVSTEFLRL